MNSNINKYSNKPMFIVNSTFDNVKFEEGQSVLFLYYNIFRSFDDDNESSKNKNRFLSNRLNVNGNHYSIKSQVSEVFNCLKDGMYSFFFFFNISEASYDIDNNIGKFYNDNRIPHFYEAKLKKYNNSICIFYSKYPISKGYFLAVSAEIIISKDLDKPKVLDILISKLLDELKKVIEDSDIVFTLDEKILLVINKKDDFVASVGSTSSSSLVNNSSYSLIGDEAADNNLFKKSSLFKRTKLNNNNQCIYPYQKRCYSTLSLRGVRCISHLRRRDLDLNLLPTSSNVKRGFASTSYIRNHKLIVYSTHKKIMFNEEGNAILSYTHSLLLNSNLRFSSMFIAQGHTLRPHPRKAVGVALWSSVLYIRQFSSSIENSSRLKVNSKVEGPIVFSNDLSVLFLPDPWATHFVCCLRQYSSKNLFFSHSTYITKLLILADDLKNEDIYNNHEYI